MSKSPSFSNVVSSLVRAQMGSSVPANTLDEELDRRVAELILKEARQKEARYGKTGSYSPQPVGNAAKTNKRFLASIIKSTDEHNKTVLRAQAEAASEVKQQRERQEREERMKRAQEAVAARNGPSTSSYRDDSWNSKSKSDREYRRRDRSRERRRRSRSPDSTRNERKRERERYEEESDEERRRKRKREHKSREDSPKRRSLSPSHHDQEDHDRRDRPKNGSSKRSPRDPGTDEEDQRDSRRSSHKRRRKKYSASDEERDEERPRRRERTRSRSPKRRKDRTKEDQTGMRDESLDRPKHRSTHEKRSDLSHSKTSERYTRERDSGPKPDTPPLSQEGLTSIQPELATRSRTDHSEEDEPITNIPDDTNPAFSSKMDKYFAKDYDPRLDVSSTLSAQDGFIPPGAFDNWDYMLQVVRQRREEKEEKKRLEKLYGSESSLKKKKSKSTNGNEVSGEMAELMSMQYTKRGGTREWDEGKKET